MNRLLVLILTLALALFVPTPTFGQIQKTESIGTVNSQTGTTYTFSFADRGKLVTFNNASPVAVTLPQATAGGSFRSGWTTFVYNLGAGTVTITPTTSTINGAASITIATGEGATVFSNGSNYLALRTSVGGTVTTTGSPASGNLTKFSGSTSITNADLTGDVTTSGGVAATIANDAVTYAKMQNISAASKLLGRGDSGSGDPQEITVGTGLSMSGTTLSASGGGSGTVNSGAAGKLAAYPSTGTTVDDTADADSVSSPQFCSDAGASDTYACNLSPAPAAYTTGTHYRFKANTANTGAASINFNSLGAKTIKKAAGGVTTDLADNDIRSGQLVDIVYDGTNMQMQSTLGNAASGGGATINSTDGVIPYRSNSSTFADSPLARLDANTIDQSNSTSATAIRFNLYGLKNGANFERLSAYYDTGNTQYTIDSNTGGTGTLRRLHFAMNGTTFWQLRTTGQWRGSDDTASTISPGCGTVAAPGYQLGNGGSSKGFFCDANGWGFSDSNSHTIHLGNGVFLKANGLIAWSSDNTPANANDTALSRDSAGRALVEDGSASHNARDFIARQYLTKTNSAPTVASGFGTSPSVTTGSTNSAGSVDVGTGGSATSGVINFNTTWPNAPFCLVQDANTHILQRATASTTQLTITSASAWTANDKIVWLCVGPR